MDVDEALAVMWQAVAGSSQAIIADQIEVSPSTLTLWKSGTVPTGKSRQKLIAWAKKVTSVPDVLAVAAERTGQNLVRLSTISGYAQAVLDMMRSVTEQQAQVVVDQLVAMGVRRVHYRGNPKPWYIESDGVASLTSSDADSLILKGKKR